MAKKLQTETRSEWKSYLGVCMQIYLSYLMLVFVLYCKEGFVEYDLYKRNVLYIGAIAMLFGTVVTAGLGKLNGEKKLIWLYFSKLDILWVGIMLTWIISTIFAGDKASAFWGDRFRYIGFSFLGLGLLGAWLLSRCVNWNVWLTRVFFLMSACVFILQIMNNYLIDLLGFLQNGTVTGLQSTLGNVNQNAYFDLIAIAIIICFFFFSEEIQSQISYGILLGLGFAGGISSRSSTFYFGIAVIMFAVLLYVLVNTQYLKKYWTICLAFYVALIFQSIGSAAWLPQTIVLDEITSAIEKPIVLLLIAVLLILTFILIWKLNGFWERFGTVIAKILFGAVVVGIVVFLICVIIANTGTKAESGLLSKLVLNDYQGNGRIGIWRITLGSYAQGNLFQKLFGIGLNNCSTVYYIYYPEVCYEMFGQGNVLADAHNVYLDMLLSSGLIGFVSYFGFIGILFVKSMKLLKTNRIGLFAVLGILAYAVGGIVNSNLIIISQIAFAMFGVFWNVINRIQNGEEVTTRFELTK